MRCVRLRAETRDKHLPSDPDCPPRAYASGGRGRTSHPAWRKVPGYNANRYWHGLPRSLLAETRDEHLPSDPDRPPCERIQAGRRGRTSRASNGFCSRGPSAKRGARTASPPRSHTLAGACRVRRQASRFAAGRAGRATRVCVVPGTFRQAGGCAASPLPLSGSQSDGNCFAFQLERAAGTTTTVLNPPSRLSASHLRLPCASAGQCGSGGKCLSRLHTHSLTLCGGGTRGVSANEALCGTHTHTLCAQSQTPCLTLTHRGGRHLQVICGFGAFVPFAYLAAAESLTVFVSFQLEDRSLTFVVPRTPNTLHSPRCMRAFSKRDFSKK
jgi:hypothetical protein